MRAASSAPQLCAAAGAAVAFPPALTAPPRLLLQMGCYLRDEAVELDAAAQAQYVADFEALAATTNKFITWDNTVAPVA